MASRFRRFYSLRTAPSKPYLTCCIELSKNSFSHDRFIGLKECIFSDMINRRPSARWESNEPWNYGGMKERLEHFMGKINKTALAEHAGAVVGKTFRLSEPFSAGQFWCCFELVADDETLVIARVRLPRHPDSSDQADEESEWYCIECEVATMKFLQSRVKNVSFPRLHAYVPPGSTQAADVGACYMLIEGFCGNTLQDVHLDITTLSASSSMAHDTCSSD